MDALLNFILEQDRISTSPGSSLEVRERLLREAMDLAPLLSRALSDTHLRHVRCSSRLAFIACAIRNKEYSTSSSRVILKC